MRLGFIGAMLLVVGLAGCEEGTSYAAVSDFNGASVKVQTDGFTPAPNGKAAVEASRICQRVGKRAEYASTVTLPNYRYEHLFLCL